MQTVKKISWIMLVLGLVMSLITGFVYVLPSPLTTAIMSDTGWDAGKVGTFISIVSLMMGIFTVVGSPIMDKLGLKMTGVLALAIGCIGGIIPFFAGQNYILHYIGRFLFGVCYGMAMNIPATIIPIWFPTKMQPALQGLRTAFSYGGMMLVYYLVLPIYHASESWQKTFGIFGIITGVVALLFLLLAKDKKEEATVQAAAQEQAVPKGKSGIAQALASKDIRILMFAMLCMIWAFNTYNTYLPTFLELEKGYTAAMASTLSSSMSIAGAIGALSGGSIASATGRRKILGWPMFLIGALGIVLTVFFTGVPMVLGIMMFGFSGGGWTILYCSVPSDLPQTNPSFYAGAMALIMCSGFFPAYFIPNVFALLHKNGAGVSIGHIFLLFGCTMIAGMISLFFIQETGPKGKLHRQAAGK